MSFPEKPTTKIDINEFGILEYLKYIPILIEQNNELLKKIEYIENSLINKLDFSKRCDVRSFLEVSESTLSNMMNDGRLKQGIHYTKTIKGRKTKIIFHEDAIVKYKGNK